MQKKLVLCVVSMMISACSDMEMTGRNEPHMQTPPQMLAQTAEPELPPPPPVVNYREATLTNLSLNNTGNQLVIKPGQSIQAKLDYDFHCVKCNQTSNSQIIVGLANRSAQACIYDGGSRAQGTANFELKVPAKPGKYEVRFRILQATDCTEALKAGWGADNSPSRETTIGNIIASKKADNINAT